MKSLSEGGILISQVHQLAGRVFARKLREHGLEAINPAQGRILFALWKGDGIPIRELAKRTKLQKSTLTSMLDRLEQDGLIIRNPSEKDRRVILIFLARDHEIIRDLFIQVSCEMIDEFYAGFSPEEIMDFEEKLKRIIRNLHDEDGSEDPNLA
ncbi:MAG TPA: MarR family transcriptional regulator [Methanospirillum sp.]|uniref:MarR family winged helix-turn-helix transcriptional regulator n=1 Tax=Methanospirillum sp. TaxID=45200 RepID=UPI002BA4297F|nr:MarR family transcriptional regulator [Methanospirillum sp.]HWQ63603.1 MarR family transcriptional regulator [Methanospirillum sp.]